MIKKLSDLAEEKLKGHNYEYDQYMVEDLVKKLPDEDIQKLVQEITDMGDSAEEFERVKKIIDETKTKNIERIKKLHQKEKAKEEEKKQKAKEWTKDEFALLAKALNKYPGGTQDRWKTISHFMGDQYSSKDIIEMAKQLTQKQALANAGKGIVKKESEKIIRSKGDKLGEEKKEKKAEDAWTDEQQKQLE